MRYEILDLVFGIPTCADAPAGKSDLKKRCQLLMYKQSQIN